MRTIISQILMLLSFTTYAAADCRVVEYPDHNEAICNSETDTSPTSSHKTVEEQNIAAVNEPGIEQQDVPPELIVRNELGNLHAAAWLKSGSVH